MTDKEERAVQKKVIALFNFWQPICGLERWHREISFYSRPYTDDGEPTMTIQPDWRYMTMFIDVDMHRFAETDQSLCAMMVLHELSHAMVNVLEPDDPPAHWSAHEEHFVSSNSKVILAAYARGRLDGARNAKKQTCCLPNGSCPSSSNGGTP